jgi:hypothetical protein
MNEVLLFRRLVIAMFVFAGVTWLLLRFVTAPYGRHARPGWGPTVPSRLAWIAMESPAVILFAWVYAQGDHRGELVPLILLGFWQFHYLQRAFVFPFRMRARGKNLALAIPLLAFAFNIVNAWINARWISQIGHYDHSWLWDPRFLCGAALFLAGWWINVRSDTLLFRLRGAGDTGYHIPKGGLHEFVASPNYLGEIVEWTGFALMSWSPAALAFAVYTVANLAPRASSHLAWYRSNFPDYPSERKAMIPFLW